MTTPSITDMITKRKKIRQIIHHTAALALMVSAMLSFTAATAMAQSRMITVTENLRKQSSDNLTFIEMRNPKTRKVYKRTMVYNGSSAQQLSQIKDAITAERDNCSQYSVMGGKVYVLKFRTKEGVFQYILEVNSDTDWVLTATESYSDNYNDEACGFDTLDESPLWLEACERIELYDAEMERNQLAIENSMEAVMKGFGLTYDRESYADTQDATTNYRIIRINSSESRAEAAEQRRIQREFRAEQQRQQRQIREEQQRQQEQMRREQQRLRKEQMRQQEQMRKEQQRLREEQQRQLELQRKEQQRLREEQQRQQRQMREEVRRQQEEARRMQEEARRQQQEMRRQQEEMRRQQEEMRRQQEKSLRNNSRIRHI